ncbi:MAG: hypothetical protein R3F05_01160 [Planctomycetota bacterium]|nr:hypothetical protein [Planctomycetota bacterium]MCB9899925.1 hypothetical protein [Planctomycetota bacterium]
MRVFVPLVAALVLIASPGLAEEPRQEIAERDAAIRASVAKVAALLVRKPRGTMADVLHLDAHYDAVERAGYLTRVPERARGPLRERFTSVMQTGYARKSLAEIFGRAEVLVVLRIDAGEVADRATSLVRFSPQPGARSHMRMSYERRDGVWSLYDMEDLGFGLPLSSGVGLVLSAVAEGNGDDAVQISADLIGAKAALEDDDPDDAQLYLDRLQGRELPHPLRAVVEMFSAALDLQAGRPQEALVHLDAYERSLPRGAFLDLLRATALNDLDEHATALEHAYRYVESIEHDVDVDVEIARALIGLGRRDEAAAVLLRTLDDAPGNADALRWLAQILPAEREAELAARLAHLPNPATELEQIAEELLDADAFDALERVTRAVAPRIPDHRDVPYYEGLVLAHRGQHREAAVKLEESVRRLTPDVSTDLAFYYVDAWLDAMLASGQGVEAVLRAPDPAAVFDRVMEHLNESGDLEARRRLVQEAATLPGLGRRLRYERADLLHTDRQFEAAVAILEPLRRELMDEAGELEDIEVLLIFDVVNRLVRDLMHLDRAEQALEVARAHEVHTKSAHYLAYVHALRGETDKAIHYLRLEQERGNYPQELFEDPDLAGILSTEPYRDIREALFEEEE